MTVPKATFLDLDFGVHKSLRYHAKRRSFLNGLHKGAMTLATVTGTAAFAALIGEQSIEFAKWSALVVAVATALDAAFGFPELARIHDDLFRQFADLAVDMSKIADPTEEDERRFKARRLMIEKEEPTTISVLEVQCANEESDARGLNGQRKIRLYQWPLRHFLTLPPDRFELCEPEGVDDP